jgi:chaperonin GroEL
MDTKIYYDNNARLRILDGINELTRAVTTSLGPKGRTAIIDDGSNHPKVTKDGASIARAVEQSSDRIKNIGINLAKEVSQKVEAVAGDGTTTSTLLFGNLAKRANEIVNLGFDVYDVKRGFEAAKEEVIKEIDNIKKTVTSSDDIYQYRT